MKKLTKIATATTLGLGLSVSAMASENIQTTSNLAVQPSADLSYAFDDSQDLQVMAMTNQEMEETEGAFIPIILNVGGRFVTSQLAKHYISNAALVYGTYSTGKSLSNR
ncbi:hypothetical protein [Psychrobacter sp. FDAARGOS_221]|uniref:hypothetical protein n=1 Tax=Psychrobacter sp. FDAARGOS_221 TaxID=1975705 RepID=UPI000BB5626B|nr:hypothetical protein [Psychrobacter sp. FDAARGOS_221]PNK59859.1 hypothetical protein A6J60_002495 [Psychrobacter sp. FDAARGOS_221]